MAQERCNADVTRYKPHVTRHGNAHVTLRYGPFRIVYGYSTRRLRVVCA